MFAQKAEAAGVDVALEIFAGMIHVFQMFPEIPQAGEAIGVRCGFPSQASAYQGRGGRTTNLMPADPRQAGETEFEFLRAAGPLRRVPGCCANRCAASSSGR